MGSILLLHTLPTANMLGIIMWYGVMGSVCCFVVLLIS